MLVSCVLYLFGCLISYLSRELEVLRTSLEKRINKALSYEVLDFTLLNMNTAASAASAAVGIDKALIAKAMQKKGKPTVEEMYLWVKKVLNEDTISAITEFCTAAVVRCDKLSDPTLLYVDWWCGLVVVVVVRWFLVLI